VVDLMVEPKTIDEDKPLQIVGISMDVTERKDAQEVEKETIAKFHALFANMHDAVILSDSDGNFVEFNDAFVTFHRYRSREDAVKSIKDALPIFELEYPDGSPVPKENWPVSKALRGIRSDSEEYLVKRKDTGESWWGSYSFGPIKDNGKILGAVVTCHDISERILIEKSLKESEERYRHLVEKSPTGIYEIDFRKMKFISVNEGLCMMLGYTQEELLDLDPFQVLDEESREVFKKRIKDAQAGKNLSSSIEYHAIKKNGDDIYGMLNIKFNYCEGRIVGASVVAHDITERKIAEDKLRRSKQLTDALLSISKILQTSRDTDEVFADVLEEGIRALGCQTGAISFLDKDCFVVKYVSGMPRTLIGTRLSFEEEKHSVLSLQKRQTIAISDASNDGRVNFEHLHKYGVGAVLAIPLVMKEKPLGVLYFNYNSKHVFSHEEMNFATQLASITTISLENRLLFAKQLETEESLRESERQLQQLLNEKVTLLKEVHHRVKNNMQMISSLIRLQSRRINNPDILRSLEDSQNRIKSMALVHEMLYKSEDLSEIDLDEYIRHIVCNIQSSYSTPGMNILFHYKIDHVRLGIDQVIPSGLIVNELVSNSLKYAFKGKLEGNIGISLEDHKDHAELVIQDDGSGLPADLKIEDVTTLGLQLVDSLVKQMDGELKLQIKSGTEFRIKIPLHKDGSEDTSS
jgi:PAS domain S-box-containing protein